MHVKRIRYKKGVLGVNTFNSLSMHVIFYTHLCALFSPWALYPRLKLNILQHSYMRS